MATKDVPNEGDDGVVQYRVHEAVAVFDNYDELVAAIEDLELAGFDRAQISLMTSHKAAEAKLGHLVENIRELEDEPRVPLGTWFDRYELAEGKGALASGLAYIGSLAAAGAIVATGGGLVAAIVAAAAAGGATGGLGLWLVRRLGQRRAQDFAEQLAQGGLVLWVEIRLPGQEEKALEILRRHAARDVHVHDVTRSWGPDEVKVRNWQPDPFLFR